MLMKGFDCFLTFSLEDVFFWGFSKVSLICFLMGRDEMGYLYAILSGIRVLGLNLLLVS